MWHRVKIHSPDTTDAGSTEATQTLTPFRVIYTRTAKQTTAIFFVGGRDLGEGAFGGEESLKRCIYTCEEQKHWRRPHAEEGTAKIRKLLSWIDLWLPEALMCVNV